jgi:hypothetical protein
MYEQAKSKPPPPSKPLKETRDEESDSESGEEPDQLTPYRVMVARYYPFIEELFQGSNYLAQLVSVIFDIVNVYQFHFSVGWYLAKYGFKIDIVKYVVKAVCTLLFKMLFKAGITWLLSNIRIIYYVYLKKKKRNDHEFKHIIDKNESIVRHASHQMTERIEPTYVYYEYDFRRRIEFGQLSNLVNNIVGPIKLAIRTLSFGNLRYSWKCGDAYEFPLNHKSLDFPEPFEKYVDQIQTIKTYNTVPENDKLIVLRRKPKIEVVHSDLLHRVWNASTFNLINGVEQLHSRVSNVINSSNDFVMFKREAKNSAINGTKNLMSYMIKERYEKDPNRAFHKGSAEFSSMGIESNNYQPGGSPLYQTLRKAVLWLVIYIGFTRGLKRSNQFRFLLGSIAKDSLYRTPISSTQSVQFMERLKDLMQEYLYYFQRQLVAILALVAVLDPYIT